MCICGKNVFLALEGKLFNFKPISSTYHSDFLAYKQGSFLHSKLHQSYHNPSFPSFFLKFQVSKFKEGEFCDLQTLQNMSKLRLQILSKHHQKVVRILKLSQELAKLRKHFQTSCMHILSHNFQILNPLVHLPNFQFKHLLYIIQK